MTDQRILQLFLDRSPDALDAVRRKYGGLLLHLATNLLGDTRDAEECVSDTLFTAWQGELPQEPRALRPWLCKALRNHAMNCLRRNRAAARGNGQMSVPLEELSEIAAPGSTEDLVDARELALLLDDFLSRQTPKDQALLMGRYFAGESYASLSRRLDLSEGACRTRLSRLREKLKTYLKKKGALEP